MSAWTQTATGRPFCFAAPVVEPEHLFSEVAHGLALINRFAGQTDLPISVAQHSVLMADEALAETGDPELAAFCLLHDGHEFAFGDWTSPSVAAVCDRMMAAAREVDVPDIIAEAQVRRFKASLRAEKTGIDAAIIKAAGLDFGRFVARRDEIHSYDMQALRTERRDLMAKPPQPWDEDRNPAAKPLRKRRVISWTGAKSYDRFVDSLVQLCPAAARVRPRVA